MNAISIIERLRIYMYYFKNIIFLLFFYFLFSHIENSIELIKDDSKIQRKLIVIYAQQFTIFYYENTKNKLGFYFFFHNFKINFVLRLTE